MRGPRAAGAGPRGHGFHLDRNTWPPLCPASLTSLFRGSQNSRPPLGRPTADKPQTATLIHPVVPLTLTVLHHSRELADAVLNGITAPG
jgi:hypothetical protein